MFWIGLVIGIFIGANIGVVAMGVVVAGADKDR
jgi:hypothetical protein